jgi:hypothetical protein
MHRTNERKGHTKFWSENLIGRHHLGDLGMDGRIILKYIVTCLTEGRRYYTTLLSLLGNRS